MHVGTRFPRRAGVSWGEQATALARSWVGPSFGQGWAWLLGDLDFQSLPD